MEWVGIVAGFAAGALVGFLGPRWLPGAPRRAPGTPQDDDARERRYKLLAADVEAALDKMEHLYDRIRKRAKVADEPAADNAAPGFLDGPAVVRYAREKGLIK